jgi:hypothetical protein
MARFTSIGMPKKVHVASAAEESRKTTTDAPSAAASAAPAESQAGPSNSKRQHAGGSGKNKLVNEKGYEKRKRGNGDGDRSHAGNGGPIERTAGRGEGGGWRDPHIASKCGSKPRFTFSTRADSAVSMSPPLMPIAKARFADVRTCTSE